MMGKKNTLFEIGIFWKTTRLIDDDTVLWGNLGRPGITFSMFLLMLAGLSTSNIIKYFSVCNKNFNSLSLLKPFFCKKDGHF